MAEFGKTLNINENTFGIFILKVKNNEEARYLIKNDQVVKESIMTAKIYPYSVALISEKNL